MCIFDIWSRSYLSETSPSASPSWSTTAVTITFANSSQLLSRDDLRRWWSTVPGPKWRFPSRVWRAPRWKPLSQDHSKCPWQKKSTLAKNNLKFLLEEKPSHLAGTDHSLPSSCQVCWNTDLNNKTENSKLFWCKGWWLHLVRAIHTIPCVFVWIFIRGPKETKTFGWS